MSTVERHPKTQAAKTTTPLKATPRPGPSPKQVQAELEGAPENTAKQPPTQQPAVPATQAVVPAQPTVPVTINAAALERHLDELAGPAGRLLAFNGQTGIHRTLDDGVEMAMPRRFDAYLEQLCQGFIQFVPDAAPKLAMVGIAEDAPLPQREDLGDMDQSLWPISEFTGLPDDPWKPQITFPAVSADDDAAEIFIYVARGAVAENSVRSLLGRWKWHPNRRKGLTPVIEIGNGTYWSKRFQSDRPKPILRIVGWTDKGGGAPAVKPLAEALSDAIPF